MASAATARQNKNNVNDTRIERKTNLPTIRDRKMPMRPRIGPEKGSDWIVRDECEQKSTTMAQQLYTQPDSIH